MKRVVLLVCVAALVLAAGVLPASGAEPAPGTSRVVMVLTPYLRWSDITSATPELYRIASEGAIGNLNVRNRNRSATFPGTVEQGALTFSAGAWAAMDSGTPSAYSVDEAYDAGTAAEAFTRLTGRTPSGADIVFLGLPRVLRMSAAADSLDVVPGTLGGEIVAAGGVAAAIGNGDPGRGTREVWHARPAAIVAMDYDGLVRHGDVSADTLRDDITEPFGVATDVDRFMTQYADVEKSLEDSEGPTLVVLDPGDLTRAAAIEGITSPEESARQHARAVATVDKLLARVVDTLPDDALLMVVTPVQPEETGLVSGFGPIIAYGEGWTGYLESSSTQRTGLVTNLDISATVLGVLGIERPVQVLGNAMHADGSDASLEERVASLSRFETTAVSIDSAKAAVVNGFIVVTLAVLLISTVILLRARRWQHGTVRRAAAVFRVMLLGILSVPPASLMMFVLDSAPRGGAEAVTVLAACSMGFWALALVLKRIAPMRVPVAALSLGMTALLLVDQWLGAPWSLTSFFGYSPLMAARYYGIGNEGAAVLFGSALVGTAFLMDQWPDARFTRFMRRLGVPLVGLVAVGTCAAPFFGANVGVIAWGVIGFAVAWALMNGHKVSWKLAVAAVAIIVLLVAAFSFIDLSGGSSSETHLGRAWQSAERGGLSVLWTIVTRKAATNLRVLTHTNWSFVLIGVLAFLGFMRWRPQGDFAETLTENPSYSAAMAACLIGGLAAYFTEDSGIVIPALIMVYLAVGILYLMLDRLRHARYLDEPAEEVRVSER